MNNIGVLARLFGITFRCMIFALTWLPWSLAYRLRGNHESADRILGRGAATLAESLGPVFVKFGQMLSCRQDLFSASLLEPLRYLRDRAEPEPFAWTSRTLRRAYGRTPDSIFAEFHPVPIGSGSVAMVFRAKMPNGKEVAVKVIRRNARRLIHRDVTCIRALVNRLEHLPALKGIPVAGTVDHILNVVSAQTDMLVEARNLSEMSAGMGYGNPVGFPHPISELTSTDVLVMDYVTDAKSFDDSSIPDGFYRIAAAQVLHALYRMMFETGVVHCDMHPGNLLVITAQRVVMVDAGLVSRLDDESRSSFRDFFLALSFGEVDRCADGFLRAALEIPRDLDARGFRDDVAALVDRYHGVRAGAFLVADFVFSVFLLQKRHRLFGAPGFASAIWALVVYEGLVRHRVPDLDFQAAARPFIVNAMLDSVRKSVGG